MFFVVFSAEGLWRQISEIAAVPALMGNGYFYTFHNLLRKPPAMHAILTTPAFGQPMKFRLVIDAGMPTSTAPDTASLASSSPRSAEASRAGRGSYPSG